MGGLIGFIILVFNLIAILDILGGRLETGKKVLWLLLVLFLPAAGVVIYFLVGRKKRI